MFVLNFGSPLNAEQRQAIESRFEDGVVKILELEMHFDPDGSAEEQVTQMMERIPLTVEQLQVNDVSILPPKHPVAACGILAALRGRTGSFPWIIYIREITWRTFPEYEVKFVNLPDLEVDMIPL